MENKREYTRSAIEELAMKAIYSALMNMNAHSEVPVEEIVSSLTGMPYEETDPLLKAILLYALKHYGEIVEKFEAHMRNWTFLRLDTVERAILLYAYSHFHYADPSIDKRIVIDRAVTMAKRYLGAKDYRFVNAILDKVLVRE